MANEKNLYKVTVLIYILQAVALVTAFPMLIAVIINYVKLDDARGSWLESHFRWQIRTFWFGLLFFVIGFILHFILIGFLVWGITWLWQVYRVIKGLMRLSDRQPMYK